MTRITKQHTVRCSILPVIAAGVLLGSAGCGNRSTVASDQPADAGFEALRSKRGPSSLTAPAQPSELDTDTQQRIADSISLLDAYFAEDQQSSATGANTGASAYDPSAERGPTGTSHLASAPIESALVAQGPGTQGPARTGLAEREMSAADRLLGAKWFEREMSDEDPVILEPAPDKSPRVVSISSPFFGPDFRWPPTPGGVGIVTTPEDFTDFSVEDLGVAVASADGSLPMVPGAGSTPSEAVISSPEARKSQLTEELVGILTELGETEDDPYRAGLALAGLETLSPGALYGLVDSGVLLPHETEILLSTHEFLQGLATDPKQGNTENTMNLVDAVRERLNQSAPLRITAAELCTRVWGYGQYDTFEKNADGSYRFMVGRRQPIIIYTEVDRFGRRPTIDADGVAQWEVELSQELQVFHLADDLLVTARTAETDTSLSRAKMRDYYLINQTYLPETLSLGKYHLKVIMRDANKDAIAEAVIPFQIVASNSLDLRP